MNIMHPIQEVLHQVPFSTGREKPKMKVPAGTCDCHHHIYDPIAFPYDLQDSRNQPPATVDAYRLLQKRLGTDRDVIVQASAYGTDNSCLLHALKVMGKENTRGIGVCHSDIPDKELGAMSDAGVCGLRINLSSPLKINKYDEIIPLSKKISLLGWHLQFWLNPNDIADLEDMFNKIECPIVFDHRGHIPQPEGIHHPAFNVISRLLAKGNTWVKLSGLDHDSWIGAPAYSDTITVGAAFAEIAPERLLWGTDWPHPSSFSGLQKYPDDAANFDLLSQEVPNEKVRNRILVDNPQLLYNFV